MTVILQSLTHRNFRVYKWVDIVDLTYTEAIAIKVEEVKK